MLSAQIDKTAFKLQRANAELGAARCRQQEGLESSILSLTAESEKLATEVRFLKTRLPSTSTKAAEQSVADAHEQLRKIVSSGKLQAIDSLEETHDLQSEVNQVQGKLDDLEAVHAADLQRDWNMYQRTVDQLNMKIQQARTRSAVPSALRSDGGEEEEEGFFVLKSVTMECAVIGAPSAEIVQLLELDAAPRHLRGRRLCCTTERGVRVASGSDDAAIRAVRPRAVPRLQRRAGAAPHAAALCSHVLLRR